MGKSIDCAYTVEGTGPAIFMVHGIGARRSGWNDLIKHLKHDFQCISYDLRGHGESPVPTHPFDLDELVDDLEALRKKLGLEKAHIIGHSLGGMIGPAYARRYPEHVLSIGLLSTAAFRTADDRAKVAAVVKAMEDQGIGPVLDTLTDRWFTTRFIERHPEVIERRKQQVIATPADIFLNVFNIYANTEMSPWLHEIRAPALVLTGELDGGCSPRLNQQIAGALPNAELVILDGLKHSILIEAPEKVLAPVKEFLSRNNS